ncbi:MAG: hypothetical protein BWY51_00734 [Parcubacteria group bacterium ADurb.Bin316]|nr:MAG: hypothetical protein BWY51_00734 [Parcubacteria group bacterium ADurb.Bin316]
MPRRGGVLKRNKSAKLFPRTFVNQQGTGGEIPPMDFPFNLLSRDPGSEAGMTKIINKGAGSSGIPADLFFSAYSGINKQMFKRLERIINYYGKITQSSCSRRRYDHYPFYEHVNGSSASWSRCRSR